MQLVRVETGGSFSYYTLAFGDGREAFLTVGEDEDPPRVLKATVTGVLAAGDVLSTVDEAETWLLNKVRLR